MNICVSTTAHSYSEWQYASSQQIHIIWIIFFIRNIYLFDDGLVFLRTYTNSCYRPTRLQTHISFGVITITKISKIAFCWDKSLYKVYSSTSSPKIVPLPIFIHNTYIRANQFHFYRTVRVSIQAQHRKWLARNSKLSQIFS